VGQPFHATVGAGDSGRSPSWLKYAVLVTNIVIFLFMLSLRVNGRSKVARSVQVQSSMRRGDQSPAGNGSSIRS
jgi:hypothetical protein